MSNKRNLLQQLSIILLLIFLAGCGDSEKIASPVEGENFVKIKTQQDTVRSVMAYLTIQFEMQDDGYVSLRIVNSERQHVLSMIENEFREAGLQEVGQDVSSLASGVYYSHFIAGKTIDNKGQIQGRMFEQVRKWVFLN